MIDEKKLLDALIHRRIELADERMKNPGVQLGGASFAFGVAVGMNHGLREAQALLLNQIEDEKELDT